VAANGGPAPADGPIRAGARTARERVGPRTAPSTAAPRRGGEASRKDAQFHRAAERAPATIPGPQARYQGRLPGRRGRSVRHV